jgi:hypothetical protein
MDKMPDEMPEGYAEFCNEQPDAICRGCCTGYVRPYERICPECGTDIDADYDSPGPDSFVPDELVWADIPEGDCPDRYKF